jgi:hypothetical protein
MATEFIAAPWEEIEIELAATADLPDRYTSQSVSVRFVHDDSTVIERPAFWRGGSRFGCRFASPKSSGVWRYSASSEPADSGIAAARGTVRIEPGRKAGKLGGRFADKGFLRLSSRTSRNLVYADGSTFLLIGDTAWALPWRATLGQAREYSQDRSAKGFNAALLMVVQPDMRATGPEERHLDLGFARGFDDLPQGTLRQIRPGYFDELDTLIDELVGAGIVPVYQPAFHGYGWKGLSVVGQVASAEDLARFQRYLIARYGARPAIWLVGGDGNGMNPNIEAAGEMCQQHDAYGHPTGIHYQPHAVPLAHQDKPWLDFQWCQTGHNGEHMPDRVARMFDALPTKAVANGEPTYENIGAAGRGAGWWQGHEAWMNLTSGGTMGVVYGAGSLWQWKLHPDEPGHADWCMAKNAGWREALDFEGSRYVGLISRVLGDLDLDGMRPNWWFTYGGRGLEVPGKYYILYRETGIGFAICDARCPRTYRVIDPKTGEELSRGELPEKLPGQVNLDGKGPKVVVFG